MSSILETVAVMGEAERLAFVESLPEELIQTLSTEPWWWTAREDQLEPPGYWYLWLILAGRGWGKTRTGAEWLIDQVEAYPLDHGLPTEWAIVAETFSDTRKICVEGPSGVLNVLRRRNIPYHYVKGAWQIKVGKEESVVHMIGADDADAGRGFNLAGLWADELAKWRRADAIWNEGLAPALRIGPKPRAVVTTTPKPIQILRDWRDRDDGSVVVTRGSTFENARNLSKTALAELRARYEGTRVGRQELYAEIIDDIEGALFFQRDIDAARVGEAPEVGRIVVSVDPAVTSGDASDETGIIVVGTVVGSSPTEFIVLADKSGRYSPQVWGELAGRTADEYGADAIVAETNQGGDLVRDTLAIAAPWARYKPVHARHSKRVRAEPVAALYEQGRVHHLGAMSLLEDQLTSWVPDRTAKSPDRIDALVHGVTDLASWDIPNVRKVRT